MNRLLDPFSRPMAKRRTIDDLLAELDRLEEPASAEGTKLLTAAIESGPSLLVARAAELVRENELRSYEPLLVEAFGRFLGSDSAPADPQCRAKTAIVEALAALEYGDPEFFMSHIGYRQIEWAWGEKGMVPVDVAAHLRGVCGNGLVQSGYRGPLPYLIELLADSEKVTRRGAAQALALTGREEAALILRMKLLCGDPDYEVVGECLTALLSLSTASAVPFVARFLDSGKEDERLEAAAALGGSGRPEAVQVLIDRWRSEQDEAFQESLLFAIGSGRRPEAVEFLISLLEREIVRTASQALAALAPCRFYPDLRSKIGEAVEKRKDAALAKQYAKGFIAP